MSEIQALRKTLNDALDAYEALSKEEGALGATLDPVVDPGRKKLASPALYYARKAVVGSCLRIKASVENLSERLISDSQAAVMSAALEALCRTGVFNILGGKDVDIKKGLPSKEIWKRLDEDKKMSELNLLRLLRLAASVHYTRETAEDTFALTRLSYTTVYDERARNVVQSITKQTLRAAPGLFELLTSPDTRDTQTVKTTAWTMEMKKKGAIVDGSIWDYFGQNPEEMREFGLAMTGLVESSLSCSEDFDWSKLDNTTLVDVGGGRGSLTFPLLAAYPNLKLVLQDRPEVVELGKTWYREAFAQAVHQSRVIFQPHDFFKPNPQTSEGVTYVLRRVIHDYSDTEAKLILQNIASVMHPNARIIVIDAVVDEHISSEDRPADMETALAQIKQQSRFTTIKGVQPLNDVFDSHQCIHYLDLVMLALNSGTERTAKQMAKVADSAGLIVEQVVRTRSYNGDMTIMRKK